MKPYNKFIIQTLLILMHSLMFSGCTTLGPDFVTPKAPALPDRSKFTTAKSSPVVRWWHTFNDPVLNTLVEKSYAQNLDVKTAGLRILQARTLLGISQGLTFPQVQQLQGKATSNHTGMADFSTASVSFDMGWELDLWGKYARGIESSQAKLYASIAGYDTIVVSVISEVARNYINYRTAQERLTYAKRNVIIQERIVKMTEIQYNSGNVSELDVQQARTQLYNTRTKIPGIELGRLKARNALALLLNTDTSTIDRMLERGNTKAYEKANRFIANTKSGIIQVKSDKALTDVNMVPKAHINPYNRIDANLVTQRPDVKAAEYLVHANSAKIGAAMAELYPSFSLFWKHRLQ